ncbi:hypothetical protein [Atopobacter phocae]|uniref:hypothetical protein n=1 Tax=Atopobacter phocae TaxID=136492 RepID=UPI00046E63C1|nr:hypothetical protein [Atopobacter phocae]
MKVFISILLIFWGIIHILISILNGKLSNINNIIMMFGGLFVLMTGILNFFMDDNKIIVLVIGFLLMSLAALLNGKRNQKINYSHHIVRFVLEATVTYIYYIF